MTCVAKKGVLFDFDGVLINSLPAMRLAFEGAYREFYGSADADFDVLFSEYRRHLGKGFPEIMRAMDLSAEMLPAFKQHSRYLARYVHTYPGVESLLSALRDDGWLLGLATGKDYARTCELLDQLGLRDYFAMIMGCDSVAAPKPAPDMATAFMLETGIPCEQLILVGDAPADLECARRARCKSIAALWGFSSLAELQQEHPTSIAESPAHLLNVCRDMSKEFQ